MREARAGAEAAMENIRDVYEPLERYRSEFRDKFRKLATDKFAELTKKAGIDVAANRRLAAAVKKLDKLADGLDARKKWCTFAAVIFGLAAACCGYAFFVAQEGAMGGGGAALGMAAGALGLMIWILVVRSGLKKRLDEARGKAEKLRDTGWEQMAPLNRLYEWNMVNELVKQTVPRIELDPYFAERRLRDLERLYSWNTEFNEGKSILCAQSGVINGNPFVFGEYVEQKWYMKTYVGTKTISWTETERDSEGRMRRVRKTATLTATVEEPAPEYPREKFMIYGNDAAPDLTFTREPSDLSGADDGFFKRMRMRRRLKKLEAFSRNLEDESQYTLMGNHEFEVLFQTMDRNHEVQYRLLFTPVAQIQMLKLLKDRETGYGDDFTMVKQRRINMIKAEHLKRMPLDMDPARFLNWCWDEAARGFVETATEYFRQIYFTLAPVLAIPLYQQTRTHEDIWRGVVEDGERASFWEYEALANYYGDKTFRHKDCVTRSILKTRVKNSVRGGKGTVEVTANGFRTVKRVTRKTVWGPDGNMHSVPVHWEEYLPVEKRTEMEVSEGTQCSELFAGGFNDANSARLRRTIYSYIPGL